MAKPKKKRTVHSPPPVALFKPQGIPAHQLEHIILHVDEYEALRLVDFLGMDLESAAKELSVSRATCARITTEARKKVAKAITLGRAIRIEGGVFQISSPGHGWREGPGAGRGRKHLSGD